MAFIDNQKVADRLKTKRQATNLSVRKFALEAGVDQSHYAKIEKGELPLTENILEKLMSKYGLEKNYILYGTGVQQRESVGTKDKDLSMQAIVNLTESNRILAESNRTLAQSHKDLVMMVKAKSTNTADQHTIEESFSTLAGLKDYVVELASELKKQSIGDIQSALNKKVTAAEKKLGTKGIHVAVDK